MQTRVGREKTAMELWLTLARCLLTLGLCCLPGARAATLEALNGSIHSLMSVIGGEVLLPCSPHPRAAALTSPPSTPRLGVPYESPLSYTPSSSFLGDQNGVGDTDSHTRTFSRRHRSVWMAPQMSSEYLSDSQLSSAVLTHVGGVVPHSTGSSFDFEPRVDLKETPFGEGNSRTHHEPLLRRALRSAGLEHQRRPVPPTRRGPPSALLERHRAQLGRGPRVRAFLHQSRKSHGFGQQPDQPVLVLWYKDGLGTPIYSFDNRSSTARIWTDIDLLGRRASFNVTEGVLLIHDLLPSDEGIYRCRVDYRNAATSIARTNLTVIVPPSTPVIKDAVGNAAEDGLPTYSEGEPLSLVCSVRGGRPPPTVRWYLGATLLDDSYEMPEPGVTSNSLHVQAIDRRLAAADLRCVAAVPQTMPVHAAVALRLNLSPSSVNILGKGSPLTAGKLYLVECEAAGAAPPAVVAWTLNGRPLPSHTTTLRAGTNTSVSTLRYRPAEADDGAQLECEATSPELPHRPLHDHWVVTVNFLPRAAINLGAALSPSNIRTGDDVFLECRVRAKPWIYRLSWRHNGEEVHHNISSGVIVHNQSLVLQKLSRSQSGLYTCIGSNTEGDGESEPLLLQVRYAPECADNQAFIYDAARHEKVTVRCLLDAFPSNVTFRWRFNNSGEMVDISAEHIVTRGLESSLSYVARTDLDYGTLLCWGKNELGVQSKPCMYRVIPAELPRPPTNCTITSEDDQQLLDYQASSDWNSETISTGKDLFSELDLVEESEPKDEESPKMFKTGVLAIRCLSDNNLELPMKFTALVYEADTRKLLFNVTNSSIPHFFIRSFDQVADLDITIYSTNNRGISDKVVLKTRADVDIAEKRTAHVRHPPSPHPEMGEELRDGGLASEHTDLLIPVLAVVLGVLGSLGLLAVMAVLLVFVRRSARRGTNVRSDTRTSSLPESPDSNPDIIPIYGEGDVSPRGMRRRGDGLECSPLCPSMSPHSPRLRGNVNMTEIPNQDPIHPGAEFVIPTALARPSERTHSGALQTPVISPALCPLNAHLCTATSITTAHHAVPASPCIVRHHLPVVEPLASHSLPGSCGQSCGGYVAHRAPPPPLPALCGVCSTCDTTPLLPCSSHSQHLTSCTSHLHSMLPYSSSQSPLLVPRSSHSTSVHPRSSEASPVVFSSSFSPSISSAASIGQVCHIPPPAMFQKQGSQVLVPAMQPVANISGSGPGAARATEAPGTAGARGTKDWPARAGCEGEQSGLLAPNFQGKNTPVGCEGCAQQPLLSLGRSPPGGAGSSGEQQLQELAVSSASSAPRPPPDSAALAPDQAEAEIDDERLTESQV